MLLSRKVRQLVVLVAGLGLLVALVLWFRGPVGKSALPRPERRTRTDPRVAENRADKEPAGKAKQVRPERARPDKLTDPRIVARLAGPEVFGGGEALTARPPFSDSAGFVSAYSTHFQMFSDDALRRRIRRLTPRALGTGTSDKPPRKVPTLLFSGMAPFWIRVSIDARGAEPGVVPPVWSDVDWKEAVRVWVYRRGPESERGAWYKLLEPAVRIRFWRSYYKRDRNEPIDWELGEHRTERLHRGVKNRIVLFYKVQLDFDRVPLPSMLGIYTAIDTRRLRINPYPVATGKEDFWSAGIVPAAVVLLRSDPSSLAERRYRQHLEYYRQRWLGHHERAARIAEEAVAGVTYKSKLWYHWVANLEVIYGRLGRYQDMLRFFERHVPREGKRAIARLRRIVSGAEPRPQPAGRQILLHNLKHPEGPEGPYDHDKVINRNVALYEVNKMKLRLLPLLPEQWRSVIGARIESGLLDPKLPWWRDNKLFGDASLKWERRWEALYLRLLNPEKKGAALVEVERLYLEGTGR